MPLLYVEDGGRLYIVASFGGTDTPPGWYRNLVAHSEVWAEVAATRRQYRARTLGADEARPIWPKLLAIWPQYADYQKRTSQEIPIVELTPRAEEPAHRAPPPAARASILPKAARTARIPSTARGNPA